MDSYSIRQASTADSGAIADIYNWYIENTIITFEETPLSASDMAARMIPTAPHCPWLVLEQDGQVQGYAYAGLWKARAAYRQTRETTIYLRHGSTGTGRGLALYQALIDELRKASIHVLIGGIALPNAASVALHERLGFLPVGVFAAVGHKFGNYIDVGYWQLTL